MKKLLSFASSKVLMACAIGLVLTLGSFWHLQTGQSQLERLNVLNQGVGICFNRISQTFTALMIKDINSPYLDRGFLGLSDECLNETIKGINPFRQQVGKGYESLNKLISEVHWFHESVLKAHNPLLVSKDANVPLNPISSRFSQMENLKVGLIDEIDQTNARLKEVQGNVEIVMGAGLLLFVLSLSLLGLKEFNRLQLQREIEREALNLLRAGQANVGAMVDRLVERGLITQGLPVSAQIFKDYHGELLERIATRSYDEKDNQQEMKTVESKSEVISNIKDEVRTSFREALVAIQNIHAKDTIQVSEVRDVQVAISLEEMEQILNAAINKLAEKRAVDKKIIISNQIHSDRTVINFFLAGNTFTASELDFAQDNAAVSAESMDMNMVLLKELTKETGVNCYIENKSDRSGVITGMIIRLTAKRAAKEAKGSKNLVSVVKGKKKDIAREMLN
jgi:hypothetical protein